MVPWLQDWVRTGVDMHAQRTYVARELARITREGARVLTQVLNAPLEIQQHLALSILSKEGIENAYPRWQVRLIDGARPPHKDPQGRDLPEEDRGHVLVAKVGTKGGALRDSHSLPAAVTAAYGGTAVQQAAHLGEDIYRYVRVTREPVDLRMEDAITILRKWGHGIQTQRYLNKRDPARMIDCWLVEEVPQPAAHKPATASPPKGRAA